MLEGFHPLVRRWFARRLGEPTAPQALGWPEIARGRDALLCAPTGSGKTFAAFLYALDHLLRLALDGRLADETRVLYVSPLRALSNDVEKNLAAPLAELRAQARAEGLALPELRVALRTGDTPASRRQALLRRPPHVLVTTPESLYLLLTAERGRERLAAVQTVIVDEIHALARDKRGAHLALSLERLEALARERPQRIGLSATVEPAEEVARFLVGARRLEPSGKPRCAVVDVGRQRALDLGVEVPRDELSSVASAELWSETYDRVAALVREHRSTLVFVNTRRLAERAAHALQARLGEDAVAAHHGSLSRERRRRAEERLKSGELRAAVATSSLELGIDIGQVDLVVQLGSPGALTSALQRIGRAGHVLSATPKGRLFPLSRDELVECAALVRGLRGGRLEAVSPARHPLDILAQQLAAEASAGPVAVERLWELCRGALALAAVLMAGCSTPAPHLPCANVACSGHGTCTADSAGPRCQCESGYIAADLECVPAQSCDPNPCTEPHRASCRVAGGVATCSCDSGYWDFGSCVPAASCSPNPCTSPHRGACSLNGSNVVCGCDPGYQADGAGECVPFAPCIPNPCVGDHRTTCRASGSTAICSCDPGFRDDGLGGCVDACEPNPCAEPHQHVCATSPSGYACGCDPGYVAGPSGGCAFSAPPNCSRAHLGGDAFEPDECPTLAKLAALPASDAHTLDRAGDEDWIAVDGKAGSAYLAKASGTMAVELSTWDATGTTLLESANGSLNNPATLSATPGASRVLFKVRAADGSSTGSYDLSITEIADDYANDYSSAASLDLGKAASGKLDYSNDKDWFDFIATAGRLYRVTLGANLATYDLWDAAGATAPSTHSPLASAGFSGSTTLDWKAPADGAYYLRVYSYYPYYSDSPGSYTLKVEDLGVDDFSDNAASAAGISVGQSKSGALQFAGDQDWFSFNFPAGHICGVTVKSSQFISASLFDSRGNGTSNLAQLASNQGQSFTVQAKLTGSGPYYFLVYSYSPYSTAAPTYSVQVNDLGVDDYGDSAADATPIPLDTSVSGGIQFNADWDWFSVASVPGHLYQAEIAPSTLNFVVYASDGRTQVQNSSYDGSGTFGGSGSGPFYIAVGSSSFNASSATTYALKIRDIGVDDYGDSAAKAGAVSVGALVPGVIQYWGDIDWLSFPAEVSHVYRVEVVPSGFSAQARVLSTDGVTVLASGSSAAQLDLPFRAFSSGSYFVSIASEYRYSSADVAYSVFVSDLGPDDAGDNYLTAAPLPLGAATSGSIQFSGDADWLALSTVPGRVYRITVAPLGFSAKARLLKSDGHTEQGSESSHSPMHFQFKAADAGPSYVAVSAFYPGATGSYAVLAEDLGADDFGDSQAQARPLVVGAAATSGAIQFGGDVDVFSFDAAADSLALNVIAGGPLATSLTVAGADGKVMAQAAGPGSMAVTVPSAGTWYLTVAAASAGNTGSYTVQVGP